MGYLLSQSHQATPDSPAESDHIEAGSPNPY